MKQYRPIATYSTMEDIMNLFPHDEIKPEIADIIYKKFKKGYGEPHIIEGIDEEAIWDEEDVTDDMAHGNFFLTSDEKHGVRLTRGAMEGGLPYGYFIDIYELLPPLKKDGTKSLREIDIHNADILNIEKVKE